MHMHVLMLCRKFELVLIEIGFFTNVYSCSKIRQKTTYYSTWSWANCVHVLMPEQKHTIHTCTLYKYIHTPQ